jgi:16S rRNA G966 N2-methylase RsmD
VAQEIWLMSLQAEGAKQVVSVDINFNCYNFIKQSKSKLGFNNLEVVKADVFKYLQKCEDSFDIIFADAPYDLAQIPEIPNIVFEKNMLNPGAWLIVEHGSELDLSKHPHIKEVRKYGQSTFSIFV